MVCPEESEKVAGCHNTHLPKILLHGFPEMDIKILKPFAPFNIYIYNQTCQHLTAVLASFQKGISLFFPLFFCMKDPAG